jgi:hypothetical protein
MVPVSHDLNDEKRTNRPQRHLAKPKQIITERRNITIRGEVIRAE